jgi:death-on-curing protein
VKLTLYPTLEETLELHRLVLERFGGQPGVRDLGMLQSALGRPQTGYYDTLWQQAAALLQSLAMNHAFLDGNKRVAFALTATFLRMNKHRVVVTATDGEAFLLQTVIAGRADVAELAGWLAAHTRPV